MNMDMQYILNYYWERFLKFLDKSIYRKVFKVIFIPYVIIKKFQNDIPVIIPYLEMSITSRCSLKCKDCLNLMQYYSNPRDYDTKKLISYFDKALNSIDYIYMYRILGGEPFLHKELYKIIIHGINSDKIRMVEVVTNGTVIPRKDVIVALQNKKASVFISNYGKISKNVEKLKTIFDEHNINFKCRDSLQWYDAGKLERNPYTVEEVKKVYAECSEACKTLVNGEIHICPRSAHGIALGVIPKREGDYIDVLNTPAKELKQKIRELYTCDYVEACYYCVLPKERRSVKAAIQLKRNGGKKFSKY